MVGCFKFSYQLEVPPRSFMELQVRTVFEKGSGLAGACGLHRSTVTQKQPQQIWK